MCFHFWCHPRLSFSDTSLQQCWFTSFTWRNIPKASLYGHKEPISSTIFDTGMWYDNSARRRRSECDSGPWRGGWGRATGAVRHWCLCGHSRCRWNTSNFHHSKSWHAFPKLKGFLEIWSCRLRVGVLWPVATCSNRSKTQVQLSTLPLNKKTAPVQNSNIASVSNNWNRHNSGFRCIGQRTRRIQTSSLFVRQNIASFKATTTETPWVWRLAYETIGICIQVVKRGGTAGFPETKTTGVWWGKKNTKNTPQLATCMCHCVTTCHLATERDFWKCLFFAHFSQEARSRMVVCSQPKAKTTCKECGKRADSCEPSQQSHNIPGLDITTKRTTHHILWQQKCSK